LAKWNQINKKPMPTTICSPPAICSPRERSRQRAWGVRRTIPVIEDGQGARPSRSDYISIRFLEVEKRLLEEALRWSTYGKLSAYLRDVGTGWDLRGPVTAKAGILLHWICAYLGQEVGQEEWNELAGLFEALLGTDSLRPGLHLTERHVLGAAAAAGDGDESGALGLIGRRGRGHEVRRQLLEEQKSRDYQINFKISEERKALVDQATAQEGYRTRSEYIRTVLLGWDRAYPALTRCAVALFWARACAGEEVGRDEWLMLDGLIREHTGGFLFSEDVLSGDSLSERKRSQKLRPAGSGDWSLRRAGEHLLGVDQETVFAETGLSKTGPSEV
jgi:hypothetical protein